MTATAPTILIVDDEVENIEALGAALRREGWPVRTATDAASALAALREDLSIRLLITDMKMPGTMDGLELLEMARHARPDVQRLLVTAFGTIEDTVRAMRSGAFDVLPKPLKLKPLKDTVKRLLERSSGTGATAAETPTMFSDGYARVLDLVRRAAPSQASVLFLGESGVGKTHFAKVLHQSSDRASGPFIALNCATIPPELLESELFGYEKGAFTGATQSRDGKILAANKGTLLLDEIGDLSPALQAKLLQFIQEKRFFKLGSNREVTADVRIVAATHRPLAELVNEGRFREDLLYRLRVVEIAIPALRDRKTDLAWLVPMLLDSLCEKNRLAPVRLSSEALARLWAHDWPGNVRELENTLESALVLAAPEELREGYLTEKALPPALGANAEANAAFRGLPDLATIEKNAIQHALNVTGGNRRLAAQLLGISERSLYRAIQD